MFSRTLSTRLWCGGSIKAGGLWKTTLPRLDGAHESRSASRVAYPSLSKSGESYEKPTFLQTGKPAFHFGQILGFLGCPVEAKRI